MAMGRASRNAHELWMFCCNSYQRAESPLTCYLAGWGEEWNLQEWPLTCAWTLEVCHRQGGRLEGTRWCELHHGVAGPWGKYRSQLRQLFYSSYFRHLKGNRNRIAELGPFSREILGVFPAPSGKVGGKLDSQAQWIHWRWTVFISQDLDTQQESVIQGTMMANFRFWGLTLSI